MATATATVATAPFGGERSGTEEGTRPGESERGSRGLRGVAGGVQGDDGAARQGTACRAECARAGHAPFPCRGGRRQRRGGQVGWAACWLGRPAAAGLHRGKPQVSPSFLLFLFSNFSDICFDLIKY